MFIAQAAPAPVPSNEQAVFFFLLAGSLAFLLWCGVSIITIIATLRRKPSIEAEFATKKDLQQKEERDQAAMSALKAEFHREIGKIEGTTTLIFQKIDHLMLSMTKTMGDIQRDIGRIEGASK